MLTTTSLSELQHAKEAIETMKDKKPALYQKFVNVIRLTRQLQYKFQYMGCLIMDEDPGKCRPGHQDDYVLSLYKDEVEKLKADFMSHDLKQLLASYQQIGYANISRLAIGANPNVLVGPVVIR